MKRPAIFFDRDNTLIVSDGYLGDPEQVKLIEGAADAVARARSLGFAVVTVSNQSGVARGMFDENAVRAVNAKMDKLLLNENSAAIIDRHEFCPFHPEATVESYRKESDARKPKAGMLLAAAEALAIDPLKSWLIGDAPRDIEAGATAGCRTILFRDPALAASPAADAPANVQPEKTTATLKEAMDYIEQNMHEPRPQRIVDQANGPVALPQATPSNPLLAIQNATEQILHELRRQRELEHTDFSVSKLFAGIVQVVALASLFFAYLYRADAQALPNLLLFTLILQALTIALLIMGKQK
ncbi:MAG TPA: HAD-IIIA family hydrolase [Tepidisphaeraceae bacterium]